MPKKLKFQEAMKRLDEIVSLLNGNNLELEDAMSLFEEGIKLSNQCDQQLKEFELKIDELMKNEVQDDSTN
ncbi:exodeoxyribonuclease VII small subunit [Floccifex sp.]|uniref:exodeoxyribonuclease VII small subunit n=1 Tax=Floccifex sp. TaxID=2815810 RepID=UPI002A766B25|nr:exodeoxyribonuclease VII small subunit [Floccifex sp.]MDD7281779.1 exodeoxyribonuclease VII small subunit [Erysipelotrichaceae bacterium]MDY2957528.1 exodeoxyribonuclease VII small subunit [Floccifex sp.]